MDVDNTEKGGHMMNEEDELLAAVRSAENPVLAAKIALEIIRTALSRPLSSQGQAGDCPPEDGGIPL